MNNMILIDKDVSAFVSELQGLGVELVFANMGDGELCPALKFSSGHLIIISRDAGGNGPGVVHVQLFNPPEDKK